MVLLLQRLYPSISVTDQASACGVSRKTPLHRNHAEANKSSVFAPAAAHHADIFRQQFSEVYRMEAVSTVDVEEFTCTRVIDLAFTGLA